MSRNYELNTHMCKEFSSSLTEMSGCKSSVFTTEVLIVSAVDFFLLTDIYKKILF